MSLKKSLANLVIACGGTPTAKTVNGLIDELVLAKDPLFGLTIDADVAEDVDLFGKSITDLQKDVRIVDGIAYGTLYYVDDYTGFSGNVEEQEGNYLCLHASVPDMDNVTITFKGTKETTLDSDGIIVIRVKPTLGGVSFSASNAADATATKFISFKGIKLEKKPEE